MRRHVWKQISDWELAWLVPAILVAFLGTTVAFVLSGIESPLTLIVVWIGEVGIIVAFAEYAQQRGSQSE